ncbi:cystatin-F [Nematolebias whitei]|uniref:cystatin-F n=1 Tax=Nematolebias whitei TaxID=451745 RepID=UPI00189B47A5|nr:cystatin-F [Nematolebias whitei]
MEVKMLLLAALLSALEVVLAAGHHGHSMPGSLKNISKSDPGLQQVILSATYSFNNQSNDAFLFKASAIYTAQQQIVKGIHYIVNLEISRTVCRKRDHNNLFNCVFQPKGRLHQTFQCHLEAWMIPWKDRSQILKFFCKT